MPQDYRLFRFPEPGWVTSFRPSILEGTDAEAPGKVLHHVVVGDHDRADFLCNASAHGHDFRFMIASGGELTTIELPEGFGISGTTP